MWWTLAAATVASCTALLIAFLAYPWQKRLDRKAEFAIEQRAALREFLESWYSLQAETRNLKQFDPTGKEPLAFAKRLIELRTLRNSLTYSYLLICPEEDVELVVDLDQGHDVILEEFGGRLAPWLDDPKKGNLSLQEFRQFVNESVSVWEPSHRKQIEKLTNSCRERTPFVEHKSRIGFKSRKTPN